VCTNVGIMHIFIVVVHNFMKLLRRNIFYLVASLALCCMLVIVWCIMIDGAIVHCHFVIVPPYLSVICTTAAA